MSSDKKDYTEYAKHAYNNIIDALDKIHLNNVTVLTGDNGSGKSFIRKVLATYLRDENNGENLKLAHASMSQRTQPHAHLSALAGFMRDNDSTATSDNSFEFIKGLFKSSPGRYLVIDEPEIEMNLSLQASIGVWLNNKINECKDNYLGILVITHSKEIVNRLDCADTFVNIQNKTKEEWMNAPIEIIDLEEFSDKCFALFGEIQKHLKNC